MKKLIALLAVCGFAFAFVACGGKKEDSTAGNVDSAAVETEEPAAVDSAAYQVDTTGVSADTAAAQ
jgi:hypothetical protein